MRRAAAAAAVERARQARIQRGQVNKGGGGKGGGKGAEAREETCITCQVEFTVGGDGGVAFQVGARSLSFLGWRLLWSVIVPNDHIQYIPPIQHTE